MFGGKLWRLIGLCLWLLADDFHFGIDSIQVRKKKQEEDEIRGGEGLQRGLGMKVKLIVDVRGGGVRASK